MIDRLSNLSWLLKTLLMLIPLRISSTPFSFNSSNIAGSWIKTMLVNYQRCRIGTESTFNSTEDMNQNAVPTFSIHKWSYPEKILPSKFFLQLFCSIALFDKARLPPKKFSMLQPVLPRAHCTFCCACTRWYYKND